MSEIIANIVNASPVIVANITEAGPTGLSAWLYAVSQGYTGTEAEFALAQASLPLDAAAAAQSASDAQAAQGLAEAAQLAAETAQGLAETAQTAAESAQTGAISAKDAAVIAKTAAESAQGLAGTANTAAQGAKTAAQTAQGLAESARDTAQGYASSASTSATTATNAKIDAQTAQTAAELAETHAKTSETNSKTSETNAGNSASAASISAGNASTSATNAGNAKTAAEAAQTAAELAETHAETAETNAETAESNAEGHAEDAEAWADGTVNGVAITSGHPAYQNNAKYYKDLAGEIVGGDYPTKTEAQGYVSTHDASGTAHSTLFGGKVDKVAGKGLSTEDYTTTEKNKLSGIAENANNYTHPSTHSADIIVDGTTNKAYTATEKTKLDGIATGAEVNVNADWNASSGDAQILNKPTTMTPSSHTHGAITNGGNVGTAANKAIYTGTGGAVQAGTLPLSAGGTGQTTAAAAATALGRGYGTCATAATTVAKVGTLSGFVLNTGAVVGIKFTYANTAASPTLNVNSTGEKAIYNYLTGAAVSDGDITAGMTALFQYNGTQWVLLNPKVKGGILPRIIATAPTGSTVTCAKGSTTLTATEAAGTWTFDLPDYGTWTVTATLSSDTKSADVVVDQVKLYTTSLSYLSDVFSENTWAKIISACQSGSVPAAWVVGNQKAMTINGASYQVDIIGKNHDTYTAGGTAPLTFQLHDCYGTTYPMNSSNTNSGGWTSCAMRTTHLPAILALMPAEVQAGIKQVNKLTSAGSNSSTINTSSNKLFLLSEVEIFGSVTYSMSGEGTQYAYYSAGNSKIKNGSGGAGYWCERSPNGGSSTDFCYVNNSGSVGTYAASYSYGVAFGFCF